MFNAAKGNVVCFHNNKESIKKCGQILDCFNVKSVDIFTVTPRQTRRFPARFPLYAIERTRYRGRFVKISKFLMKVDKMPAEDGSISYPSNV